MTLNQMRYVQSIARWGKMSLAAEKLFITQPTLSGEIKKLEKELQIQIFERTRSGIVLTPAGEELLEYIGPILDASDYITEKYKNPVPIRKKFAVAGHHSAFISNAFIAMTERYRKENYLMRILEGRTMEVIEYVRKGICDLGVLVADPKNRILQRELEAAGLIYEVLKDVKPHVYICPGHPLAEHKILTLEELLPYPFMIFEQGEASWQYFSEEIEGEIKSPRTIIVTDRSTQINLARRTDAYTIGTGCMDHELTETGTVAIPLESENTIQIIWLRRRDRQITEMMQEYLELLQEKID